MSLWLEHKFIVSFRDIQNDNNPIEDRRERPFHLSRMQATPNAIDEEEKGGYWQKVFPQMKQYAKTPHNCQHLRAYPHGQEGVEFNIDGGVRASVSQCLACGMLTDTEILSDPKYMRGYCDRSECLVRRDEAVMMAIRVKNFCNLRAPCNGESVTFCQEPGKPCSEDGDKFDSFAISDDES